MPGTTRAKVVEDVLHRYFEPEVNLVIEERLLRRIDAFDWRQSEIERNTAPALGQRRFDHFIQQVAKKLGNERGVATRVEGIDVSAAESGGSEAGV